jgi:hypothetical protein
VINFAYVPSALLLVLLIVTVVSCRGEEGASCFEYLMAHGARYNQQSLEELGAAAAAGQDD